MLFLKQLHYPIKLITHDRPVAKYFQGVVILTHKLNFNSAYLFSKGGFVQTWLRVCMMTRGPIIKCTGKLNKNLM